MDNADLNPSPTDPTDRPRRSGRAALIGVLGISLILSGGVLLTALQAPVVSRGVVAAACALIAIGCALLPVAWMGRKG